MLDNLKLLPMSQDSSSAHGSDSSSFPPSSPPMLPAMTSRRSSQANEQTSGSAAVDRRVQVITSKDAPFLIVWASEAWLELCQYTRKEVIGRTLDLLDGPQTSAAAMAQLHSAMTTGQAATLSLISHTRTGDAYSHSLRVEPLCDTSGARQCYQATSSNIEMLRASQRGPSPTAEGQASPYRDLFDGPDLKINEMLDLLDAGVLDPSALPPQQS